MNALEWQSRLSEGIFNHHSKQSTWVYKYNTTFLYLWWAGHVHSSAYEKQSNGNC